MPAYSIAEITVTNPDGYEAYKALALSSITHYGGRYIARGGAVEVLEGELIGKRVVVVEFPSMEQARKWYHSPEYSQARGIRQAHSVGRIVLVEGL